MLQDNIIVNKVTVTHNTLLIKSNALQWFPNNLYYRSKQEDKTIFPSGKLALTFPYK